MNVETREGVRIVTCPRSLQLSHIHMNVETGYRSDLYDSELARFN